MNVRYSLPAVSRFPLTALCALSVGLWIAPVAAQARAQTPTRPALDRSKIPPPGRTPHLRVPSWTRSTLPNGAQLVVSQKRDLPIVSVTINFVGGSYQFEDSTNLGVASFVGPMLSEGTMTRSGDDIAGAQQLLGTEIDVAVGGESGAVSFTSLSTKLDAALELAADMLLNPTFPADALERLRSQRIVALTAARDQPASIAANVFTRTVYGDAHPYGRVLTEGDVKAITRDEIVAFHRDYFRPGRAIITVVGDVDPARVRASIEKAFAQWSAGGDPPEFNYPALPPARATTIYLVDKPQSAQSVVFIGAPGPPRNTNDYYAIAMMNFILGGHFQSRLNALIRETKGYSYGVSSRFEFGKGPGAFRAAGAVTTAKTDSALMDFMSELRSVQGGRAFTDDEMQQGRDGLIQSLPARFERVGSTAQSIASIYVQGLPENYFQEFSARINALTSDDLVRVAKQYLDLDHVNIVIVGDRAAIEPGLRATGIAPIEYRDIDGRTVARP